MQALLIALVAGLVLAFHARQRTAMRASAGFDGSAGARVDMAFRYAVCFVAVFVILMALGFGTYGVFRAYWSDTMRPSPHAPGSSTISAAEATQP